MNRTISDSEFTAHILQSFIEAFVRIDILSTTQLHDLRARLSTLEAQASSTEEKNVWEALSDYAYFTSSDE